GGDGVRRADRRGHARRSAGGRDRAARVPRVAPMILRVDGIHTFYGLVPMLQGVSLEIERGEVLALLGRNGAGKTTVIKSILGLVPPRAGKALSTDEDITALAPHLLARP